MTCEIKEFEPAHFEALELKSVFTSPKDALRRRIAELRSKPGCYLGSVFIGDEPVAVVGIIQNWPGVAEAWSVASESVRKAPVSYTRQVKRMLSEYESKLKLHRVQMTVRREYVEGIHWAEVLGFRSEGVLRGFGPDRADYVMFARVA